MRGRQGRMRGRAMAMTACLTVATAGGVLPGQELPGQEPAAQELPSSWTEPVEPFALGEELWYVGTAELGSYLFTSDDGHILLDVPLEENAERVEANIRTLGFDPADVRIVLTTQAHFDHVGGVASFARRHDARVFMSAADAEMAARGGAGPGAEGLTGYPAFRADRTLGHLDRVRLGGWELTAHLTPGHTPGCTSWSGSAHIGEDRVPFVVGCSLGILPGYTLRGTESTYPGIDTDFCRSVAHLRSLPGELFLGAHASFFGLEAKRRALEAGNLRAFVDPDRYRRYLDANAARIDSVLVAQGAPGGCARILEETADPDRTAILEASRAFSRAYVQGDTAAVRALYTDDALLLPPGREIRGRDAIVRYFGPVAGRVNLSHAMTSSSLEVRDDQAVDIGIWSNRWRVGDGPEQEASARYLVVWRRGADGRWRIETDMWHRPGD